MQYFTAAWATGGLDDADLEKAVERYNEHVSAFDQQGQVYSLATTVSLHDAYLDRLVVDSATGLIELLLLTGDLQVGYWRTTLSYRSARIADGQTVLAHALSRRPTEIWYDEFANNLEGMSHSFLLAPRTRAMRSLGEFRIDFQGFSFSQAKADARILTTPKDQSVWN